VLGQELLLEKAAELVGRCRADEARVLIHAGDSRLTRFAENTIHQNVAISNVSVQVQMVLGRRVGVASTNSLEDDRLDELLEQVRAVTRNSPLDPEWAGLPGPQRYRAVDCLDEQTAGSSPQVRAEAVRRIVLAAEADDCQCAGAFSCNLGELAIANTRGLAAYHVATDADFRTVVTCEDGSGAAHGLANAVGRLDVLALGQEAIRVARQSRKPKPLEPGTYRVILMPEAVASLVGYLAYMGLGAKAVAEQQSFLCGRIGTKITGAAVTLWDDGLDPAGMPMPFDFEGVAKAPVALIEKGVARGVVYDTKTAAAAHQHSTGHAMGAGAASGPLPMNLFLEAGDTRVERMIATCERGLLVHRLHYVNIAERMSTQITGMTRDGTFWIEDGHLRHPVQNLRFNQSILEALDTVEQVGHQRTLVSGPIGAVCCVPALRLERFRFTGTTRF
jgi:predicted Zn-dependent protease